MSSSLVGQEEYTQGHDSRSSTTCAKPEVWSAREGESFSVGVCFALNTPNPLPVHTDIFLVLSRVQADIHRC
jgi:hypothetical protein